MNSVMALILEMVSRGNTLEAMAALNDQPLSDSVVIFNRVLYSGGRADNAMVLTEIERLQNLLGQVSGTTKKTALYNLGCFFLLKDDVSAASSFFQQALDIKPDDLPARHNLGYAQELMADAEAAQKTYAEVLKRDANFILSSISMSLLWAEQGNRNQALDNLRKLFKTYPANTGVLYYLVHVLLQDHGPESAKEVVSLLAENTAPWERHPQMQEAQAYAFWLLEEWDQAETAFQSLAQSAPQSEFALLGLAKLYGRQARISEMKEALRQLAELNPAHAAQALLSDMEALGM